MKIEMKQTKLCGYFDWKMSVIIRRKKKLAKKN